MPLGSSKNVVLNGILKIFFKPLKGQSQRQESETKVIVCGVHSRTQPQLSCC